ncbi:UNVERIFIED_CONTAM: hypothetical protein Sangu_2873100 [Sesamum angustifolium]|uniref:Uncharacterized protein n=1 Tax=Sesamum angustifolium TaxID=2727405 RepID=A0AAW2IP88_9LAMI
MQQVMEMVKEISAKLKSLVEPTAMSMLFALPFNNYASTIPTWSTSISKSTSPHCRTWIKGAFTVNMINGKHVLISLSNEADLSICGLRRIWHVQGFPMRVLK